MTAAFRPVIGLEVHVQLLTESKLFCPCPVRWDAPPNSQVCPVCLGHPGSLPVPNRRAFALGIRAGLAFGCTIAERTAFDRKNYFYPDLPKGYQVSQYDRPLCTGGAVAYDLDGDERRCRLERIHLEEDAGKSLHAAGDARGTRVDLNRAGTPLLEIVTAPDLRTPEEAQACLDALKREVRHRGLGDANMEQGSLRCDANISMVAADAPEDALGTKVEIKNLNSFNMVRRALAHEAERQGALLAAGDPVRPQTRLWDDDAGRTEVMRDKEDEADYRYFREPDIPEVRVSPEWVARERDDLPEGPRERRARWRSDWNLPADHADVLVDDPAVAAWFEAAAGAARDPRAVAGFTLEVVLASLRDRRESAADHPVAPDRLAALLDLVDTGAINRATAKDLHARMLADDRSPDVLVEELGVGLIADEDVLADLCRAAVEAHPAAVADVRAGKAKARGALVGHVMRETGGRADPEAVQRILSTLLDADDAGA